MFALLARRIPRRTSRPPHSRAGTSGTSSKAEFSNVTISLRSISDRDHAAGYTENNAAQPSVPISGKTLSGTPMMAMPLIGLGRVITLAFLRSQGQRPPGLRAPETFIRCNFGHAGDRLRQALSARRRPDVAPISEVDQASPLPR